MDDRRAGWLIRRIRQHLRLRQVDVAAASGVSQQEISLIELGRLEQASLRTLRSVLGALGGTIEIQVRWRGGDLDRIADEGHALLVATTAEALRSSGWTIVPEVSYSVYGERGSIDLVAWHPQTRTLLVVEVKTELTSVEATLRKHDEKVRLAGRVVQERFGWQPWAVGRLLVLPDVSTARRRVERHEAVLRHTYPVRGTGVRRWLREPNGPFGGLAFLSTTSRVGGNRGAVAPMRIRKPRPRTSPSVRGRPEASAATRDPVITTRAGG